MEMCTARAWLPREDIWTAQKGKLLLLPFTEHRRALESCKDLVKWYCYHFHFRDEGTEAHDTH